MKYPDNILEVSSLYQIIWDLSLGKSRYFDGTIIPTLPGSIKSWCFVNETLLLLSKVLKHDLQVVQLHEKNQWTFVKNCEASCQKVLKL
jgi:hypothetical protein